MRGCPSPLSAATPSSAASNNRARSATCASSSSCSASSTRCARSPTAVATSAAPCRSVSGTPAIRRSLRVRARARGKPGVAAAADNTDSRSSRRASNAVRAATASSARVLAGAMPRPARRGAAMRAASCVRLNRDSPMVAGRAWAMLRARSSAAPRVAATILSGCEAGYPNANARAASRRLAADGERTQRRRGVFVQFTIHNSQTAGRGARGLWPGAWGLRYGANRCLRHDPPWRS